jgi:dolichol kinase
LLKSINNIGSLNTKLMTKYYTELARKIIHLSSLWIPLFYLNASEITMLKILFPLLCVALIIDYGRRFVKPIDDLVKKYLGQIMRDEEKDRKVLTGATYMLMASVLTIMFFSKEVAIFALTVLIISDATAALVGKRFGRIRFFDKSLEGSISFAVSAILVYYFYVEIFYFSLPLGKSLLVIMVATIVELFAKKLRLDDNLAIPLVIGILL